MIGGKNHVGLRTRTGLVRTRTLEHPHIPAGAEGEMMIRAFTRDFQRNGPSVARIVRTTLAGWKRYKNHPDARIRRRYAWESRELPTTFAAVLGACKRYYRNDRPMHKKISALLANLIGQFGWKARLSAFFSVPRPASSILRLPSSAILTSDE